MKLRKFVLSRDKRHAYMARWASFHTQPWICVTEEMYIEEAKRRWPFVNFDAIGVSVVLSHVAPLEVCVTIPSMKFTTPTTNPTETATAARGRV
jgi:hypothetical protein